jgi:glycosyltransferase involved in cell wall biosynthesis
MPPPAKANILYLNHASQVSGAEASLLSLLAHLNTGEFRPLVGVGGAGPFLEELRRADIQAVRLDHPRFHRSANPAVLLGQYVALRRAARRIAHLVADESIDLVHANSLSSAISAARALGKRVPLVYHARDLRLPAGPARWVIRRARAIIAISHAVAAALGRLAPEAPTKTVVVQNGLDADAFAPRNSRARLLPSLGLPEGAVLVGGAGQLVPWKNWDRFLRVGAAVAAHVPRVHLLIIGQDLFGDHPGYVPQLKALADRLAISRLTHFLGYQRDIAHVVSALDVFVHCAEEEPLGRAIMEAMALERPVVAVGAAGPAEIIVDGETGLLAPSSDPYAMSERVVRLLRDPELARRLGQAARHHIQTSFPPERTARTVEEVYRAVLWDTGALRGESR